MIWDLGIWKKWTFFRRFLMCSQTWTPLPYVFVVDCFPLAPQPYLPPEKSVCRSRATVRTRHRTTVQFSHSVMSDSLWPQGLQHARLPCPSPSPRAYLNSYPLHQWCHTTISSSVIPFSSCLQSFPASGSFPVSVLLIRWPKYWSFSFNISPSNEYSGLISFRVDWLDHLAVQGTLKSLLQHHSSKASILLAQLSLWSNFHINTWQLEKP